jgi:hypothetical protein
VSEAGLPRMYEHVQGDRAFFSGSKGVVRALYPDLWRVDIETDDGSLLNHALVVGPYFPELHKDGEAPSHVGYCYVRGMPDVLCWPMPHRRLLGPDDSPTGEEGQGQPERRYYALHNFIFRSGDITWRITKDQRFVLESEAGDYIQYDQQTREIRVHAPTVFIGTEDATRLEYQQDEVVRILMPKILVGDQALMDTDGLTYIKDTIIHLVSSIIKLTASDEIILDPPRIRIGNANASEHLVLGDQWMALYNAFVALFNGHQHSNVQNGAGISGPPTTPTAAMSSAQLSDIAFVSKTGV